MEFSNFSDELREKSKSVHDKSDRLVQLKLAVVLTDIKLYQQVLCDFHCVFNAIERGVDRNILQKFISKIWKKDLARTELIEEDLNYYAGIGWKNVLHPSDAAISYASHIDELALNDPVLLIAYIHTMYLGKCLSLGLLLNG